MRDSISHARRVGRHSGRGLVSALAPRLASALLLVSGAACASAGGGGSSMAPAASPSASVASAPRSDWRQMFNGRDLSNWDIKFRRHPLGVNFNETFRVEEGLLKVRYDKWTGWNGEFGHVFYKEPFSHYLIGVEYRFVGNQVTGAGPSLAWAIRNNGIMAHGQSAQSMGLDQDFPASLEIQLLGGLGRGPRSTANLCTPGTTVYFGDKHETRHCISSASKTFEGDQWVRVEALVLGDSIIKHIVNGDTVMTYRRPQLEAPNGTPDSARKLITGGSISLQAETAEIDFRKVEILNLKGCMVRGNAAYKPYFIQHDATTCR